MNMFFDSACVKVFSFNGCLFLLDLDSMKKKFEEFKFVPLQRIRKRQWANSLIDGIPDWTTYDFYHDKNQEKEIERLFGKDSLDTLVNSLRTCLFFDGFSKIELIE